MERDNEAWMQNDKVQIFDMTENDISFVSILEQKIFSHPWSADVWQKYCRDDANICLAAFEHGKPAGYCGVSASYETADLCRIAVDPQFRRRGVARALLTEVFDKCRERQIESVLLEVRCHNKGARLLYHEQGFQEIHIRKGYYREPVEDAVVMQLSLSCFQ